MDYQRFITVVERAAAVGRGAAERATRATLQTLAERISVSQARDLVEQLPPELGPWLLTEGAAERFDVDEFLRRVATRSEADMAAAERQARAVFTALARTVSTDEFADMVAQLPKDFAFLLPRGPAVEVLPSRCSWTGSPIAPGSTSTVRGGPPTPCSRRSPSGSPTARSTT
jgi:uncharacterized protein (DUF2267 family)